MSRHYDKCCIFCFALIVVLVIIIPTFVIMNRSNHIFTIVSVSNVTNSANNTNVEINIAASNNKTHELVLVCWGKNVEKYFFNYTADMGANFTYVLKNLSLGSVYIVYLSENMHQISNEYKFWT